MTLISVLLARRQDRNTNETELGKYIRNNENI